MRILLLISLLACHQDRKVTVDCDKYMAKIDDLALAGIAALPEGKREAAEQRRVAGRPDVLSACRTDPVVSARVYECEMAATTRNEFKACK